MKMFDTSADDTDATESAMALFVWTTFVCTSDRETLRRASAYGSPPPVRSRGAPPTALRSTARNAAKVTQMHNQRG